MNTVPSVESLPSLGAGTYKGEYKDGLQHGRGLYVWPSGSSYEGDWVAGAMHGTGLFSSPDGSRYEGSWQHDLKHGFGAQRAARILLPYLGCPLAVHTSYAAALARTGRLLCAPLKPSFRPQDVSQRRPVRGTVRSRPAGRPRHIQGANKRPAPLWVSSLT